MYKLKLLPDCKNAAYCSALPLTVPVILVQAYNYYYADKRKQATTRDSYGWASFILGARQRGTTFKFLRQ